MAESEDLIPLSQLTDEQLAEVEKANAKIRKHADRAVLSILDQVLQGQRISTSAACLAIMMSKAVHMISIETNTPVGEIWTDFSNFIVMEAVNFEAARVQLEANQAGKPN